MKLRVGKMKLRVGRYPFFQLGLSLSIHKHADYFPNHCHVWVDIGFWYIELTIGKEESK